MKPVILSIHAQQVLIERELQLAWIETAARSPAWRMADPDDPTAERRFAPIAERGGRVLRVVCKESNDTIYVVTAFLDRRARRP